MKNIGLRIKKYRESKGYKVKEFAALVGISQGSLSNIENDVTRPSAETLSLLVRNTDIPAQWLLVGDESVGEKIQPVLYAREEQAYINKLVAILRGVNKTNAVAIKTNLDAFYKSRNMGEDDDGVDDKPRGKAFRTG